jgi:hypothetical protein
LRPPLAAVRESETVASHARVTAKGLRFEVQGEQDLAHENWAKESGHYEMRCAPPARAEAIPGARCRA